MTSIFVNNSGSPVITDKGTLTLCSGDAEIKQRIFNIIATQKGSELFDLEYGLDHQTIIETPNISANVIRALVIDALNPDRILGVIDLNSVLVEIVNETAQIIIVVVVDSGVTVESQLTINIGG